MIRMRNEKGGIPLEIIYRSILFDPPLLQPFLILKRNVEKKMQITAKESKKNRYTSKKYKEGKNRSV